MGGAFIVGILIFLLTLVVGKNSIRKRAALARAEASQELRMQFLRMTPQDLNLDVAPHQPFFVLMDIKYPPGVVSVAAALSGDVSIYFSGGGGIIGGAGHESVRNAGIQWVREAANHLAEFSLATSFVFPHFIGDVCFFVGTPEGVLVVQEKEATLQTGSIPLAALYARGQDVFTALREVTEKKPAP